MISSDVPDLGIKIDEYPKFWVVMRRNKVILAVSKNEDQAILRRCLDEVEPLECMRKSLAGLGVLE